MMVLAGDVGGTKALLALAQVEGQGRPEIVAERRYASAEFGDFTDLVHRFLHETRSRVPISAACFGIAGPVEALGGQQQARLTNLPWPALDSAQLAEDLDLPRVVLVNDFAAIAHALPLLGEDDLVTLQVGRDPEGAVRLIAGAGTGFGVCALCPDGEQVIATEGGHAGFAPADEEQARLLDFVTAREGRCTREHLLCGRGILRMVEFLQAETGHTPSPELTGALAADDAPAAVSRLGLEGRDALAARAMGLFARVYAGQLGDLALSFLARGGVYVAGGIAPRILPLLKGPDFLAAFNAKPPMQALLEGISLRVITHPGTGLLGAVARAVALVRRG